WCSVRISKEISEFASGKAEEYVRERALKSPALTPEQRQILEQRGVLSAEEIHRLASKTKKALGLQGGDKAACHSDVTESAAAYRHQTDKLVQLRPRP